jgi:hypothetical protein
MKMRMEDIGKAILKESPYLTEKEIEKPIVDFFSKYKKSKYYLLLSREVGYYTVFEKKSDRCISSFIDFLNISFFIKDDKPIKMSNIQMIEMNEDLDILEIWIDKTYFQLSDFDWGVEVL